MSPTLPAPDSRYASKRLRWPIFIAPVLVFIALAAWVFATPIGSSPDEDYHLNSIWCGQGLRPGLCEAGSTPALRRVPIGLEQSICEKAKVAVSPSCQTFSAALAPTARQNANNGYPKLYYWVMSHFASTNLVRAVTTMRLVNVGLFALLTTLLFALLPPPRRPTLVLGLLAVLLPLGAYLIATVNPSGWVITGCATAWLATVGYFEAKPLWRKIALAALAIVGILMAAGTRGDGAVYVALAVIAGTVLAARRTRAYWLSLVFPIPLLGAGIAYFFAKGARQLLTVIHGELGSAYAGPSAGKEAVNVGIGLLFQNITNLPMLWLGSFGGGGLGALGWFDVPMPYLVQASALLAFGGVVFWGLRDTGVRKALALLGVLAVITIVPLWFLQISHFIVGSYLQPRYLYPGIVILGGIAVFASGRRRLTMSYTQMGALVFALTVAYGTAMYGALVRYVDASPGDVFFDLNAHRQWWWSFGWLPDPMKLWILATIAFAAAASLSVFFAVPHSARVRAAATETEPETEPDAATTPTALIDAEPATEPLSELLPPYPPHEDEPTQAAPIGHDETAPTEPLSPLSGEFAPRS